MFFDPIILVHFSLLLLTFYTLCIICDEYLVPAVEVFIKQFNVPEELAAVTLVAFGSAAPELFLNSVSAVTHTSDLSLAAILGSGMIAFGLIPPLCFLSIHREEVKLKLPPILRECGFYIIGLSLFLSSMRDGKIATKEALLIVSVYLLYVGLVFSMYYTSLTGKKAPRRASLSASTSPTASTDGLILDVSNSGRMKRGSMEDSDTDEEGGSRTSTRIASESQLDLLMGGRRSPGGSGSNSANANDDIEDPVVSSTHSNFVERTVAWINHCISTPISFALGLAMPQLHPQASSPWTSLPLSSPTSKAGSGGSPNGRRDGDEEGEDTEALLSGSSDSFDNYTLHRIALHSPPPMADNKHSAEAVPLWRAIMVLGVSIVCIGVLAGGIVSFSEAIVKRMGIDTSTLGATLVALGAEIPDTISSITLAKNGYYDGAIAGAIGSQVINISLGVGLPALFVCLSGNGYLTIAHHQSDSLWMLSCLLFVVIGSYVAVTIPLNTMLTHRIVPDLTQVGKSGAVIQIFVWCTVYAVFIYNNEG